MSILGLIKKTLKTKSLISHSLLFDKIDDAYKILLNDKKALGILINYQKNFQDLQGF